LGRVFKTARPFYLENGLQSLYKAIMKLRLAKCLYSCAGLLIFFSNSTIAQNKTFQQLSERDSAKVTSAKREIVEILFTNIFRSETKDSVYLSTRNIPIDLQENFPKFANLATVFVSPDSEHDETCPFVFHNFSVSNNKATVSFGNCSDGLGYNFEKINGKWEFSSSIDHME
jgi:hypothetical protein